MPSQRGSVSWEKAGLLQLDDAKLGLQSIVSDEMHRYEPLIALEDQGTV